MICSTRSSSFRAVFGTALAGGISLASSSAGAATSIWGGPAYNSITSTGYSYPTLPYFPGRTAGNGVGVGHAMKFEAGVERGFRAFRWDASGTAATELGYLGTDDDGSTLGTHSTHSFAYAINGAGTATGYVMKFEADSYKGYRAVRWDASGTTATELGNLGTNSNGFTNTQAFAINEAGTAAGFAYKGQANDTGDRAVRWDASGTTATELGHIGTDGNGSTSSSAYAINATGTAVGYASKYDFSGNNMGDRAVRWDASGTVATELGDLGTNSGYTNSYAYAVNDAGTAVGYAYKYESDNNKGERAVRWDASGTVATELGNLGTDNGGVANSFVYAINAAGAAVGYAEKYEAGSNKGTRAVRWDASNATAIELGNFGTDSDGNASGEAFAINAAGIAVGMVKKYDLSGADLGYRAVAWGTDGVPIDLNALLGPDDDAGWINLFAAIDITDAGWITGHGSYDPDGAGPLAAYNRAFLLNASGLIPEPASLSLLALGGTLLLRRRRV